MTGAPNIFVAHPVARGDVSLDTDPEALAAFRAAVIQGTNQQAREGASRQVREAVAASARQARPDTEA